MNNLIKKHAKSFYWASFFLSKPVFYKCSSLYNFCRTLDDMVDDNNKIETKKESKKEDEISDTEIEKELNDLKKT